MSKLQIGIISCGGTIVMEKGIKGALEPKKKIKDVLDTVNLAELKKEISILPENCIELFILDSSNLNQSHWVRIIDAVRNLQNKCDGILIFHGTDTMAYSATAVGLALCQKLKVSVVFTGSQKPIGELGSDAISNVERSMLVLKEAVTEGVLESMVFFDDQAFRSVNTRKRSESEFAAFESPNYRPLFTVDGMGVKIGILGRKLEDIKNSKNKIKVELKNAFANGIIPLSVVPGLEPGALEAIAEKDFCRVLILNSFGVGNVPSEGKYSVVNAIDKIVHKLKKIVIVTSPFVGGNVDMNVYLPGKLAMEAGAIDAGSMTAEAALVKTRLLLAHPEFGISVPEFKKALLANFAGENPSVL
ncbi:MAG: asparaginase domain-containing protein [Candidatus Levyibacteriota bacterium]